MCGIIAIIGNGENEATLGRMLMTQKHRGPDNTGTYIDPGYAHMGHNRLAIIDTSTDGNQPFLSKDGRYVLSFNGEIYNYKEIKKELASVYSFKTQSDTEVLLKAYIHWGDACLDRLKGMFAFAIWDTEKKELFAARDRFGVKPLYYSVTTDGKLLIASEIKALHEAGVPKVPNDDVWAGYFAFGSYGAPSQSFWKHIKQLPGGHSLSCRSISGSRFRESELTIKKWFDFIKLVEKQPSDLSFETVKEQYAQRLEKSIKLRFRADVPIGFNLSGGLDSSTLLYLVNTYYPKEKERCRAYTFYTGDERYDELPWVEMMLKATGNDLQKVLLDVNEVPRLSKAMTISQDEPYGGIPTLAYGQLFDRARSQGVKVLLDGQGMDEQWAGYDYYHNQSGTTLQGVNKSPFRPEVLSQEVIGNASRPEIPTRFDDPLQQMQYRDLFYTKIPRALRFNDRASMAHSVELREPFLDEDLVAFAFAQPSHFKYENGQTKYALRQLVRDQLDADLVLAPKRALQTPQREWLGEELSQFVQTQLERLLSGGLSYFFDKDQVMNAWNAYKEGDRDSSFHIWQLVNTALTT